MNSTNHESRVTNHGALQGRIALITGASRGIGAAVAKRFAAEGAQLILIGRNVKGLEETDDAIQKLGAQATLIPLDLQDGARIAECARAVAQRFGRIDILVGNAGVLGETAPIADSDPDEWERTMRVNLDANMNLIRAFDPLLKQSAAPRAIFVTSGIAHRVSPYWNAYAVSKAALEMMVKLYAAENEKAALRANLISPGAVRTRMRAKAFPGEDPDTLPAPENITDIFVRLAAEDCHETGQVFNAQ